MTKHQSTTAWALLLCSSLALADGQMSGDLSFTAISEQTPTTDGLRSVVSLAPEVTWDIAPEASATFAPYLHYDQELTTDIHKAKVDIYWRGGNASLGIDQVTWGKMEFSRLSDRINQTDLRSVLTGDPKQGQAMARVSQNTPVGQFELLHLFDSPERKYPTDLLPADVEAVYADAISEESSGWALRYDQYFGAFDVGIYGYTGVDRDPAVIVQNQRVQPYYDEVTQAGIDLQYTAGSLLIKSAYRQSWDQIQQDPVSYALSTADAQAYAIGAEYALNNNDTASATVFAEYATDSRGESALQAMQNDVSLGAKFGLNNLQNTEFTVAGNYDLDDEKSVYNLRAEHRWTDRTKLEVNAYISGKDSQSNPINYQPDSRFDFSLSYNF